MEYRWLYDEHSAPGVNCGTQAGQKFSKILVVEITRHWRCYANCKQQGRDYRWAWTVRQKVRQ